MLGKHGGVWSERADHCEPAADEANRVKASLRPLKSCQVFEYAIDGTM